jgi:hypothetical protein
MTKDEDAVTVRVELCKSCPDIHLVVEAQPEAIKISVAMTDEEWQGLISNYHKLRQQQLSPGTIQ